jgi:GNAT superfamily N-acetyltransferase
MPIAREDHAVDEVRELICALKEHHGSLSPELGPVRGDNEFWAIKRAQYLRQLAEEDGALFVARDDEGAPVGFAFAAATRDSPTWDLPAVRLEDLVVAPQARGSGTGAQLMAAVRAWAGPREIRLHVLAANAGALRFYEREGFTPWIVDLRAAAD